MGLGNFDAKGNYLGHLNLYYFLEQYLNKNYTGKCFEEHGKT